MKMQFSIGLLLLFVAFTGYSQNSNTRLLDEKSFHRVLNRQFTNLITGQATNTLGSFAAVDLKEAAVSFNGSRIFSNGNVLSLTASGSVSDGLFALFNNSQFNTGVSLGVQYHILSPYSKTLNYDLDDYQKLYRDSARAMDLFRIRKRTVVNKLDSISWRVQIRELEKELRALPRANTEEEVATGRVALEKK